MILHKKVWGQHKFTPTLFSKGGQLPPVPRLLRPCFLWYTLEPPDLTREEWIFFFFDITYFKNFAKDHFICLCSSFFIIFLSFLCVHTYVLCVHTYVACLLFFFFSFRFALCSYFGKFHIVERIDCILILKKKHNKNIRSWFFFSAMPDANYIFLSH